MQSSDHVLSQVLSIYGPQHRWRQCYFVISPANVLFEFDEVGYDKAQWTSRPSAFFIVRSDCDWCHWSIWWATHSRIKKKITPTTPIWRMNSPKLTSTCLACDVKQSTQSRNNYTTSKYVFFEECVKRCKHHLRVCEVVAKRCKHQATSTLRSRSWCLHLFTSLRLS